MSDSMRNGWTRSLRVLLVLVCAACLGACSTAPINAQQTLTGQEGAVVLRLITNGTTQFDPVETLSALKLKHMIDPADKTTLRADATLVRTRESTRTTAIFSGMIRPGTYAFEQALGGQGNVTYMFPLQDLGRFEVKTGEVSLLGTVLIQPGEGRRFRVGYLPPDDELRQSFEQLYPALAAQVRGKPVHSIERTPVLTRSTALAPTFKRFAARWNGLDQGAKGEFFAGAKLGKVLWRKAGEARWRELDTGSWLEVTSVRPYKGGLLVAGEEGLLRLTRDDGRSWVSLTPPERSLIMGVLPLSSGGVLALTRRDGQWGAYLTDDVEQGQWRKLGEFAERRSINIPWSLTTVVALDDALAVSMPEGSLVVVDSRTITTVGSNTSTVDMAVLADGTLVSRVMPFTASTMMSKDRGKSWVDLDTSRFTLAIAFKDTQTAYAVLPTDTAMIPKTWGLKTSRDGGRTWTHTGIHPGLTAPTDVQQLVVDRSNGALLAFLKDNAIVQSVDEGKTWKLVKDY